MVNRVQRLYLPILLFLLLGSAGATTLTFQTGNMVLTGQNNLITATATFSIDTVQVIIDGDVVSSGTNIATYNANSLLPGTYNVTARDITGGITQVTNSLVVNSLPSGILAVTNITLTNTQSVPDAANIPYIITLNSLATQSWEASNLDNIKFFYYNGTTIPSFLEASNSNSLTNTIYALRIYPALASGASITIYEGYASLSTNLFSNVITGEAPQLTAQYAQYDTGANVFPFYDNFFGNTIANVLGANIINGFSTTQNVKTWSINNGLSVNTINSALKTNTIFTTYSVNIGNVFDTYGTFGNSGSNSPFFGGFERLPTITTQGSNWIDLLCVSPSNCNGQIRSIAGQFGDTGSVGYNPTSNQIYSIYANGIRSVDASLNYGSLKSQSIIPSNSGVTFPMNVIIYFMGGTSGTQVDYWQWADDRVAPANNIMPTNLTSSINIVPQSSTPTLTYSSGNTMIYGMPNTITASCNIGDNCGIYYGSNEIANAISTVTYNAGLLGVGNYPFYANDITTLVSSATNTLVITRATPLITFPNFPTNHPYTGIPDSLTANIQTINNQVTANDYINTVLITSFTTQNTINEVGVGTYTMVANSFATANYIAGTNTISYTIGAVAPTLTYSIGNTITYSLYNLITATCTPGGDTCAIWYGSNQLASGTGSATYNTGLLGVGTYGIYGYDLTSGTSNTVNTLTITQAYPLLWFPNFPANYLYTDLGATITFNIITTGNQVTANAYLDYGLLVNNVLIANTNSQTTYLSPAYPTNYIWTLNSLPTANYFGGSNSITLQIYTPSGGGGGQKVLLNLLNNSEIMVGIEWLFGAFALILIAIRLVKYREASVYAIMMESLSGIFWAFAIIFFFSPVPIATAFNSIGTVNVTANYITTQTPVVASSVGYEQFLVMIMAIVIYEIFIVLLLLLDVPPVFFTRKLPNTPK